jgi:hypothetical protein
MKIFMKRAKLTVLLLLAILTAVGGLSALLPQHAAAAPFSGSIGAFDNANISVTDQAAIWSEFWAAYSPGNNRCFWVSGASASDITSGKWLDNQIRNNGTYVGHHVDPTDGKLDCSNESGWFSNLLTAAGIVTDEQKLAVASQMFKINNGKYSSDGSTNDTFKNIMAKDLFGGKIPNEAPDYITYQILYLNFTAQSACNAIENPTSGNVDSAYHKPPVDIYVYDPSAPDPVKKSFIYKDNVQLNIHRAMDVGVGFGLPIGGAGDGVLQCSGIAAALADSKYAKDMLSYSALAKPPDSTDPNAPDPTLECAPVNALNWIMCPIIVSVNKVVAGLDAAITSLLTINQKAIFDTGTKTGAGYYAAWQTFRYFALAILIIGALIMIIAQSLGFQILDAYTIKKILPRLIVAIIGIALSWELMKFFVIFTNDLGNGVRHIIYYPFRDMDAKLQLGNTASIAVYLITGAAVLALSVIGLVSFALTGLLAVLVAFLVLIIRQLVVVVLILFAPIAIACSILPNTQSVYKLWHESFTKAMLMFPIIVAFLAIGRVFAITSISGNVGSVPALSQLIGFAAYFMPYFLIPMTFRFAGGAMRMIGGSINDKNRGAFDRLKKYRGNKLATNMHAMKEGKRYRNNNPLARGFNSLTHSAAMAPSAGLNPWQMKSRYTAAMGNHTYDAAEEIRTKNSDFLAGAQDDKLLYAARDGRGRAGIRQELIKHGMQADSADLDTAVGVVERMQASGDEHSVRVAAATQLAATGTGYKDSGVMLESIAGAAHGDRALAGRMLGTMRSIATQSGRGDLGAAGYGVMAGQLDNAIAGGNVDVDALNLDALRGNDAVTVGRWRNEAVSNIGATAAARINTLEAARREGKGTPEEMAANDMELGRLTGILNNLHTTSGMYAAPQRVESIFSAVQNSMVGSDPVRKADSVTPVQTVDTETRLPTPLPPVVYGYREQGGGRGRGSGPEPRVVEDLDDRERR